MTEHLRPRELEACAAGIVAPEAEPAAHLAGCTPCREQVAALERERRALLDRLPAARFVAAVAARRRVADQRMRRRRLAAAGGLAAVCAAAVAVLWLVPATEPGGMRAKGLGVELYRKRGDRVDLLDEAGRVRAGDQLRVSLTLPAARRVALWFVDARGHVDPYPGASPGSGPGGDRELAAGPTLLPGVMIDRPCLDMTLVITAGAARFERTIACE